MLPYRQSKLTRILLILFFVALLGYAYYEVRGILYGPQITLPSDIVHSTERFITVRGQADRIATLRMNGGAVSVTEEGVFEEPLLLAPGLNRVVFDAEDKYGNRSRKVLQIVYTPQETPENQEEIEAPTTSTTSPRATKVIP